MSLVAAPERYVLAHLVATQRWAPPTLVLIGIIAWIWATPPIGLDTVRLSMVALFALACWLGHATGSSEEPALELISTSCCGSPTRLLLAKWSTATGLAVGFPLLMLAGHCAYDLLLRSSGRPAFSTAQAAASTIAFVAIAIGGAALGILATSIVPGHPGWAAGLLIIASLAQAAPWMLPVPPLAAALPVRDQPIPPSFLTAAALAVGIAAALLIAARLLRRPVG